MIMSNGAFYSIFPMLYGLLLGLWYYVLFPKSKITDRDTSKITLVVASLTAFFVGLYWFSWLFNQTVLLKTLFPSIVVESLLSWIALLAGTAWMFVITIVLHSLVLSFVFSIELFPSISWVVSANFISYLIALSVTLFIL